MHTATSQFPEWRKICTADQMINRHRSPFLAQCVVLSEHQGECFNLHCNEENSVHHHSGRFGWLCHKPQKNWAEGVSIEQKWCDRTFLCLDTLNLLRSGHVSKLGLYVINHLIHFELISITPLKTDLSYSRTSEQCTKTMNQSHFTQRRRRTKWRVESTWIE
jgi:hypothetical protein